LDKIDNISFFQDYFAGILYNEKINVIFVQKIY